jgi:hypothetical protein
MSIRWYPLLKPSKENDGKSLSENISSLYERFVICQQLEYRYYTAFENYIEYGRHFKTKVSSSHQCFYEVIFDCNSQKPYFDLDVDLKESSIEEAEQLRNEVIVGIRKEFEFINETDIIECTSHSETKRSYHIIVDNWCVLDSNENKAFFHRVQQHVSENLKKYLDASMYKSVQQFRLLGCRKWESERVKIISKDSLWKPPVKIIGPGHKFMLELAGTIVTNTSYCKMVPGLTPLVPKKAFISGDELTAIEAEECLNLCAKVGNCSDIEDPLFPYQIKEVRGSMILLQRTRPSECRICKRIHENENPYLTVSGSDRNIYFHCRRDPNGKKLLIGKVSLASKLIGIPPIEVLSQPPATPTVLPEVNFDSIMEMGQALSKQRSEQKVPKPKPPRAIITSSFIGEINTSPEEKPLQSRFKSKSLIKNFTFSSP